MTLRRRRDALRLAAKLYAQQAERIDHRAWRAPESDDFRMHRLDFSKGTVEEIDPRTPPRAGDCPRPEGCVVAHECRICGADRGEPCRSERVS